MEWIDVTVPIRQGMVHWPDNRGVRLESTEERHEGGLGRVSELSLGVHTGTHFGRAQPLRRQRRRGRGAAAGFPGRRGPRRRGPRRGGPPRRFRAAPAPERRTRAPQDVELRALLEHRRVRAGLRLRHRGCRAPSGRAAHPHRRRRLPVARWSRRRHPGPPGSAGGGGLHSRGSRPAPRRPWLRRFLVALPLLIPGCDGAPARVLVRAH